MEIGKIMRIQLPIELLKVQKIWVQFLRIVFRILCSLQSDSKRYKWKTNTNFLKGSQCMWATTSYSIETSWKCFLTLSFFCQWFISSLVKSPFPIAVISKSSSIKQGWEIKWSTTVFSKATTEMWALVPECASFSFHYISFFSFCPATIHTLFVQVDWFVEL